MNITLLLSCFLFFASCSLTAPRTTTTYVTSNPSGASVFIVHSKKIYDKIYPDAQMFEIEGKKVSLQGQTPLNLSVPKGAETEVIIGMEGYKPVEFEVNSKMPAVYYEGNNTACLLDKYWSWSWGGFVHKAIKIFRPSIYKEHCTQTRHNFHIRLDPES